MKKKIARVLAAMMAVGSMGMASFAEETEAQVTELNWEAVEPIMEAIGVEGDFVTFDEVAVKMWLPSVLDEVELTDEDKRKKRFVPKHRPIWEKGCYKTVRFCNSPF